MSYYINPHGHQCPWYPYSELLGYPSANWCEEVSCFWISEPVSTYSSMAFILIASILFGLLKKKNHPDLKLFLNLFLFIGVGAALYHLSLNYLTQLIAHGLIYTFFGAMVLKNFIRQGKISYSQRTKFLLGYVLFFLIVEHILYTQFLATQILVPISYLVLIISEFMCRSFEEEKPKYNFLVSGFIILIIAEAFSMMDLFKVFCNPQSSYFHGHALWHILAGISFAFAFLHMFQVYPDRSEEQEIDFDTYEDEEVEDHVVEFVDEDEQPDIDSNEPQFDSVLDLNEDQEIDEDQDPQDNDEEEEDDTQIQFNFDDEIKEDSEDQEDAEDQINQIDDLTNELNQESDDEKEDKDS